MAFQIILQFDNIELEKKFLGPNNRYLELISDELKIKLNHISGAITIDEVILFLKFFSFSYIIPNFLSI